MGLTLHIWPCIHLLLFLRGGGILFLDTLRHSCIFVLVLFSLVRGCNWPCLADAKRINEMN
jgi:hypothetical protein